MNYHGQAVTVMGLGHFGGGVSAARWLAGQGAEVTVTDLAGREELAHSLAELDDVTLAGIHLDGHSEEDFARAELIVVNPAVRPDNRFLDIARRGGARLTSEIELFMEACPASIIGVTGSNGKSTTAAMIAEVLRANSRTTYLGGNIGVSLLKELPRMTSNDWVVLELSSFQLALMNQDAAMPHIAVVTNFSPNHLNWHDTLENYRAAKRRLLEEQPPVGIAVLEISLLEADGWSDCAAGQVLGPVDGDELPTLAVPGEHNRRNAALAAAAARAAGCSPRAITEGLNSFRGLPGRLQMIAEVAGRQYYNDTTATTPESTIAAVRALDDGNGGTWLLAGGSDKGVDLNEMAVALVRHTSGAAFFGSTAERLHELAVSKSADFTSIAVETLAEAFAWCHRSSRQGDCILLSPGCASLDQFQNFQHRGRHFDELAARAD